MKNCKQIITNIPDFLVGNLDQLKQDQFQKHLNDCPTCKTEVESLSGIWGKMEKIPEEIPETALKIRFENMLDVYKQGMKEVKQPFSFKNYFLSVFESWRLKHPAFQFAGSVMLLLIGLTIGYFLHPIISNGNNVIQLREEIINMQQVVSLTLLKQKSASDRLQGVMVGSKIAGQSSNVLSELINTLNTDPNVNVRLAAVNALYLYRNNPQIKQGLINSLSVQESPLVQIALVDLLSEIKEEKTLHALKELIKKNHLNPEVKKRAESWLNQLL
ncbi:HEAT repeat domain-containing protein [candidate division KSB1 bacterium]|nr:HEAT repeat domain-containing protein [candidate division KSB1 bacterium]